MSACPAEPNAGIIRRTGDSPGTGVCFRGSRSLIVFVDERGAKFNSLAFIAFIFAHRIYVQIAEIHAHYRVRYI